MFFVSPEGVPGFFFDFCVTYSVFALGEKVAFEVDAFKEDTNCKNES